MLGLWLIHTGVVNGDKIMSPLTATFCRQQVLATESRRRHFVYFDFDAPVWTRQDLSLVSESLDVMHNGDVTEPAESRGPVLGWKTHCRMPWIGL